MGSINAPDPFIFTSCVAQIVFPILMPLGCQDQMLSLFSHLKILGSSFNVYVSLALAEEHFFEYVFKISEQLRMLKPFSASIFLSMSGWAEQKNNAVILEISELLTKAFVSFLAEQLSSA